MKGYKLLRLPDQSLNQIKNLARIGPNYECEKQLTIRDLSKCDEPNIFYYPNTSSLLSPH
jgi:hypothetical protein